MPTGSPLGHQLERHLWCLFLTAALEDVLVEAPLSRGAHHEIKVPAALLGYNKYKTAVDRSDQKLSTIHLKGIRASLGPVANATDVLQP